MSFAMSGVGRNLASARSFTAAQRPPASPARTATANASEGSASSANDCGVCSCCPAVGCLSVLGSAGSFLLAHCGVVAAAASAVGVVGAALLGRMVCSGGR